MRHLVLRELVACIGIGPTVAIVRGWGGQRLRVPAKMTPAHPLALALGLEPAARLVEAFRGVDLDLPREVDALREARHAAVVRARAAGDSHDGIGRRFGMTRANVVRMLAIAPSDRGVAVLQWLEQTGDAVDSAPRRGARLTA